MLSMKRIKPLFILLLVLLAGCGNENIVSDDADVRPVKTPASTIMLDSQTVAPVLSDELENIPTAQPEPSAALSSSLSVNVFSSVPYQTGDQGEEIALIQQMLIELGFDPGDPDGIFGVQMRNSVENFQLYIDINVDGVVNSNTIKALLERQDAAAVSFQDNQPLKGYKIGIDPGHQRKDNDGREPIAPGSKELKKMVSAGTYGRYSNVPEYVINLQVGLKLKASLEALGAHVIMTRKTHDVNITNAERAKMMNEADVDCWLRIHANGRDDPNVSGMFFLVPGKGTMNTDKAIVQEESVMLAEVLIAHTLESTGANNLGIKPRSDQTGFCWSSVPVCNIEMGHMTNEREDLLLVSENYQKSIVEGLTKGFVEYFS